jgi:hypothetical protein
MGALSGITFSAASRNPYGGRKRMDFNALWLLQFYGGPAGEDSVRKEETASTMTVPGQNPHELLLTAEDCAFLLEVGIRP